MLDREGYRPNVGIVLLNARNEVFWGKRIGQHSWQFPQGGIQHGESPELASGDYASAGRWVHRNFSGGPGRSDGVLHDA